MKKLYPILNIEDKEFSFYESFVVSEEMRYYELLHENDSDVLKNISKLDTEKLIEMYGDRYEELENVAFVNEMDINTKELVYNSDDYTLSPY